jgi:hypothetical protein
MDAAQEAETVEVSEVSTSTKIAEFLSGHFDLPHTCPVLPFYEALVDQFGAVVIALSERVYWRFVAWRYRVLVRSGFYVGAGT